MPNSKLRIAAEAAYLAGQDVTQKKYNSIITSNHYFSSLNSQGYKFLEVMDNKRDGFYAIILRNGGDELLVAIRGTDFYNFKVLQMVFDGLLGSVQLAANLTAQVMVDDLYSDLQIVLGKIPKQCGSAEVIITNLTKLYPVSKIFITGHSLGGFLSQLIAAKFGIEAIVFDSPGAKKPIEKLIGGAFDQEKITIINSLPNFINTCGEHIKPPIAINNGGTISLNVMRNFLGTMPHKSGKKPRYLCSHGMEDILNSINIDGIYNQIPIKAWPKNCMSFYASMEAYNAMPEIYNEYICEMWKRECKNPLRAEKLTLEAYKNCFLKQKLSPCSIKNGTM